jgi:serine/threonine protein kinase
MPNSNPPSVTGSLTAKFEGIVATVPRKPDIFSVGDVLSGTYEIQRIVGRGAMGQVALAKDLFLERQVAIKTQHGAGGVANSLRAEAQAMAAVHHPAVLSVHGMGSHNGIPYMVLEYIEGIDLELHLRHRVRVADRFAVSEALDFLVPIAEALAATHRHGVWHRDIKPGNVMLTAGDRVVLIDFGVGQREGAESIVGESVGTPEYMAPEVYRQEVGELGWELADMYSFGVMAYELIAGKLPFSGGNVMLLCYQHSCEPVPPFEITVDAPPRLEALLTRMLAKEPGERPRSMSHVAEELRMIRATLGRSESAPVHVLVVDDDEHSAAQMAEAIKQGAPLAHVDTVHSAEAAIVAIRNRAPHLLILDLLMPEMNGFELYTYLTGSKGTQPMTVVAISEDSISDGDVQLLKMLGVADVLPRDDKLRKRLRTISHEQFRQHRASLMPEGDPRYSVPPVSRR